MRSTGKTTTWVSGKKFKVEGWLGPENIAKVPVSATAPAAEVARCQGGPTRLPPAREDLVQHLGNLRPCCATRATPQAHRGNQQGIRRHGLDYGIAERSDGRGAG